jgi:hypothetical protein
MLASGQAVHDASSRWDLTDFAERERPRGQQSPGRTARPGPTTKAKGSWLRHGQVHASSETEETSLRKPLLRRMQLRTSARDVRGLVANMARARDGSLRSLSSKPMWNRSPAEVNARLALSPDEAAASIGVSRDFFDEHVAPELRVVRRGRRKLIPVRELERWLEGAAGLPIEPRRPPNHTSGSASTADA